MKPLVGINVDIDAGPPPLASVQTTYVDAVRRAGGIPLLIPPMPDADLEAVLDRVNGLLLIGGLDYSPDRYGEVKGESVQLIHADREEFDFRLLKSALDRDPMPILGICGGCQLLNIGLGGSLVQDIKSHLPDSPVQHSSPNGWKKGFPKHAVAIEPGSLLGSVYGRVQVDVPTSHHQSVARAGRGLKVVARAEDGIVEAVEHESRPFTVGVQWHPERDYEGNARLFQEFVQHCSRTLGARVG